MTWNLPAPCGNLLQASSPLCISPHFALLPREGHSLSYTEVSLKFPACPLISATPGREREFRLLPSLGLKSA